MDTAIQENYIHEIKTNITTPIKPWKKMSPSKVQSCMDNIYCETNGQVDAAYICSGSLGFYLYLRFLQDTSDRILSEFILDVALFQNLPTKLLRENAENIRKYYFLESSKGNPLYDIQIQQNIIRKQALNQPRQKSKYKNMNTSKETTLFESTLSASQNEVTSCNSSRQPLQITPMKDPNTIAMQQTSNKSPRTPNIPKIDLQSIITPTFYKTEIYQIPINEAVSQSRETTQIAGNINNIVPSSILKTSTRKKSSIMLALQTAKNYISPLKSTKSNKSFKSNKSTKSITTPETNLNSSSTFGSNYFRWEDHMFDSSSLNNSTTVVISKRSNLFISPSKAPPISQTNILKLDSKSWILLNLMSKFDSKDISVTMFDEVEEIIFRYLESKYFTEFASSQYYDRYFEYMTIMQSPVTLDDFIPLRVIGRGGFGLVSSCKKVQTGKIYVMKVMSKKRIKFKHAEKLVVNEWELMKLVDPKYIVGLTYSFVTSSDIYFIMDFMVGGDLAFHLTKYGRFTKEMSRYFIARLLMGLMTLHEANIVYRDIKPENILMDETGRTRLSDLGLACLVGPHGIRGASGTRGYWAPEVIRRDEQGNRTRYNITADYFSVGTILYEFLAGVNPFRAIPLSPTHSAGILASISGKIGYSQATATGAGNNATNSLITPRDRYIKTSARSMAPAYRPSQATPRLSENGVMAAVMASGNSLCIDDRRSLPNTARKGSAAVTGTCPVIKEGVAAEALDSMPGPIYELSLKNTGRKSSQNMNHVTQEAAYDMNEVFNQENNPSFKGKLSEGSETSSSKKLKSPLPSIIVYEDEEDEAEENGSHKSKTKIKQKPVPADAYIDLNQMSPLFQTAGNSSSNSSKQRKYKNSPKRFNNPNSPKKYPAPTSPKKYPVPTSPKKYPTVSPRGVDAFPLDVSTITPVAQQHQFQPLIASSLTTSTSQKHKLSADTHIGINVENNTITTSPQNVPTLVIADGRMTPSEKSTTPFLDYFKYHKNPSSMSMIVTSRPGRNKGVASHGESSKTRNSSFTKVLTKNLSGLTKTRLRRGDELDEATLYLEPEYPEDIFDSVTKDLIMRLLMKDPRERLGSGPMGIHEILEHEFFDGLDLECLNEMDPIYKPNLDDVNALDANTIGDFPNAKEIESVELNDMDHDMYKNCNHTDNVAFEAEIVETLLYEDMIGPRATTKKSFCSIM